MLTSHWFSNIYGAIEHYIKVCAVLPAVRYIQVYPGFYLTAVTFY